MCVPACALLEGAGCLQRLRLFSVRDYEDGEDHPGQAELGPAQRHTTALPAHRECVAVVVKAGPLGHRGVTVCMHSCVFSGCPSVLVPRHGVVMSSWAFGHCVGT